jgi:hypothetical protein
MLADQYLIVEVLSPLWRREVRHFCFGFEFDFHETLELSEIFFV